MRLVEKRVLLPHSSTLTLFVFGDLQFGSSGFDQELWEEFQSDFKSAKNPMALGLGDYSDFARPSIRAKLRGAFSDAMDSHEELDEIMRGYMEDKIYPKLEFMKGKILGLHQGHHEWEFRDGSTSTQEMCRALKTDYLGWVSYTVLKLMASKNKGKTSTAAVKIFSTHGSGGGATNSGDLGNLERKIAPFWVSDLYLRGHSSRQSMTPLELNDITVHSDTPKLIKKVRWLVNCAGFMKGYNVNQEASYVERKNLPPACRGWAKIEIKFSTSLKDIDGKRYTGVSIQPILRTPSVIRY